MLTPSRSSSKENIKISVFVMNTRCHRIQQMTRLIIGNYLISRRARKPAGAGSNRGFRFATNVMKASSKKNCAGRTLRIKGLKRFQGPAMTSLVLLVSGFSSESSCLGSRYEFINESSQIGGLVHGSRVQ